MKVYTEVNHEGKFLETINNSLEEGPGRAAAAAAWNVESGSEENQRLKVQLSASDMSCLGTPTKLDYAGELSSPKLRRWGGLGSEDTL